RCARDDTDVDLGGDAIPDANANPQTHPEADAKAHPQADAKANPKTDAKAHLSADPVAVPLLLAFESVLTIDRTTVVTDRQRVYPPDPLGAGTLPAALEADALSAAFATTKSPTPWPVVSPGFVSWVQ